MILARLEGREAQCLYIEFRRLYVKTTVGSLDKEEVYDAFYNHDTRRLFQVVPEGAGYAMKLVEDINERKNLLYQKGILTNPYNFTDL